MSLFDQMVRSGGNECYPATQGREMKMANRTFKETINDQIAYHKAKIVDLENVRDSMTPDVERFVEALQRLG